MTRKEFEALVLDTYGVSADYPFEEDFETGVFRHESGKWFALAMNISYSKLSPMREGRAEVVNLKCDPEVIESIVGAEPGVYRAYHMNKTHWLTVDLAECDGDCISWLLGISHELTGKKIKRR
jgi:predicted DNA-binding protein (MmcQ/YjbR family)